MTNDENGRLRLRNESTLRAYLELVRLPNLFTAMADAAMGFLLVGSSDLWVLGLLMAASTLLYASGMVLNDVFDFSFDARERRHRPLPSGRVPMGMARWLGWELLILGVATAWAVGFLAGHLVPGVVGCLLAACIVAYDAGLKQTPLGPVAMGACRMLNVLLGISVTAAPWQTEHWLVAGGIGVYVAGITWFARTESRTSGRVQLVLALAVMLSGIALLAWFPSFAEEPFRPESLRRYRLLMTVLGLLIGWRCFRAVLDPIPARVQMAVGHAILSIVVLDAAVCYIARGTTAAVCVLTLLAPAMLLRRWFQST